MNMNTKLLELLIVIAAGMLVIIGSMSALAQASGYKCTIKQSLQLGNDGSAQPLGLADMYRNKEFIVDRASGRVLGDINYQVWNHQVWIAALMSSHISQFTLRKASTVTSMCCKSKSFREGAIKPFLLMQGAKMHMGTCTHLR
jgi:hypothetical protein